MPSSMAHYRSWSPSLQTESISHTCFRSKRSKALRCRFYENEVPDVQDTVVAKVKKITELGAYVTLTEYNNKGTSSAKVLYEFV